MARARRGPTVINYEVHGAGETLVLVHGLASNLHTWDACVERLSQNFRILTLDLPGFGASECGHNGPNKAEYYLDVRAVVTATTEEPVSIVGWSLGARVALDFALAFPESIASIIMIDHNPADAKVGLLAAQEAEVRHCIDARDLDALSQVLADCWLGGSEPDVAALRPQLVDMIRSTSLNAIEAVRGVPWPRRIDLADVDVPVLIVQGLASKIGGRRSADYLGSQLRRSTMVLIAGHGHAVHMSAPDDVSAAITEFIKSLREKDSEAD